VKRARFVHEGREQWGVVSDGGTVSVANGRAVPLAEVVLLPPAQRGATVFALGLNYADHSAELGFKAPDTPLVFLKGYNSFVAHNGVAPRPRDATQMHPECELVAVIGRPARNVPESKALDYISAYTIACDYAIRDYLENYYRPNLRDKNRDALTPLGPYLVDPEDVGDPQALSLSTIVNGRTVQQGSTSNMVFSVRQLIAYLSRFMTLMPGDMILTGTPHGVHFVADGDEILCEIARVGRLMHRVCADR
jgi:5-oxopent-3-ene-1,2,5-tricarboxylate decarboxylase / 2-hydroxyhepta-2,4-diene-1,7-dioate isomerase